MILLTNYNHFQDKDGACQKAEGFQSDGKQSNGRLNVATSIISLQSVIKMHKVCKESHKNSAN